MNGFAIEKEIAEAGISEMASAVETVSLETSILLTEHMKC
jgi:hypothetical protein